VRDKVYLGSGKLRALLLFSLPVLGNAEAKAAGMLSIKRFGDPGLHTFGFGVLDQHANPSRSLQNCPMTSD
jgi:hypothetical protein